MSKKITDLSKGDVVFIVKDMFGSTKVTNIKFHKREDYITLTSYAVWIGSDDDGNPTEETLPEEIKLQDPWSYGNYSIEGETDVSVKLIHKWKQFCISRDIYPDWWFKENPYITKEKGEQS